MRHIHSRFIAVVIGLCRLLPAIAEDVKIWTDDPSSVHFLYGCQTFTKSGTYENVDFGGGDSRTLSLVICGPTNSNIEATIQLGQTFLFGCDTITPTELGTTTHYDTLLTALGCDSIVILSLTAEAPAPIVYDSTRAYKYGTHPKELCAGETFTDGAISFVVTKDTTFNDTIIDYLPRIEDDVQHTYTYIDSVITYQLTVWQLSDSTLRDSIELGQPYTFKNMTFTPTAAGLITDYDTLSNTHGCDSIVTLQLKVVPITYDTTYVNLEAYDTLCVGSEYTTRTTTFTLLNDTIVRDTVDTGHASHNTDTHVTTYIHSAKVYYLSVWHPSDSTLRDSIELGQSYTFKGATFTPTTAGLLTDYDTLPNFHGCDSIVTLQLKVVKVDTFRTYVYGNEQGARCVGDTYTAGSQIVVISQDTTLNDTVFAIRQAKDDILHTFTYTDSVTTYTLTAWQPSDSTLRDSIELGQSYTFKNTTFTPTTAGSLTDYDTLPNFHGCDSIVTLQLKVIAVTEERVYVHGATTDTLCIGADYAYGNKSLKLSQDTVLTDTVYAVRQKKDEALHTLTYTDSVATHTLRVWHNALQPAALNWGYAFCGTTYTGADDVLAALRAAIAADDLFPRDTLLAFLYKDDSGNYVPYTGFEMNPDRKELALRATVTNSCTTLNFDTTLSITQPDYTKSEEFADMPAVSKYGDWLLMIDLDSINKVYGLNPEPDSVRWYRITGANPDLSVDQCVGTGYYYTDDRQLSGKYYAIIGLPEVSDACGGSWRTRIVVHAPANAPLRLVPTVATHGAVLNLYNLTGDAPATLTVYDAEGCMLQTTTRTSDGINALQIHTDGLPAGVYLLHVSGEEQQQSLRFIIQ